MAWTEDLTRRSYTRKVFCGDGAESADIRYRFHLAHQHYKAASGLFLPIDTALWHDGTVFRHSGTASFEVEFPEYADGRFVFANKYETADFAIAFQPVATHAPGETLYDATQGHRVLYADAFGRGIHLTAYCYNHGERLVVSIPEPPKQLKADIVIEYLLTVAPEVRVFTPTGEWNQSSQVDFTDNILRLGTNDRDCTWMRSARMWDSSVPPKTLPVPIALSISGTQIKLTKTLPLSFLRDAIYPVYTDHPTTYYSGAGDGFVGCVNANWNTAHDATSGTGYSYTATSEYLVLINTTYSIYRGFIPIDTSGIDDGAEVTAAVLYLKAVAKGDADNDAQAYAVVVQTSQADPTKLANADFDTCGDAIDNPTQGSNQVDITGVTTGAYNAWTLTATGRGWVSVDGYTYLGLREGHDCEDAVPAGANNLLIYCSESGGTGNDPYLDVTADVTTSTSASTLSSATSITSLSSSSTPSTTSVSAEDNSSSSSTVSTLSTLSTLTSSSSVSTLSTATSQTSISTSVSTLSTASTQSTSSSSTLSTATSVSTLSTVTSASSLSTSSSQSISSSSTLSTASSSSTVSTLSSVTSATSISTSVSTASSVSTSTSVSSQSATSLSSSASTLSTLSSATSLSTSSSSTQSQSTLSTSTSASSPSSTSLSTSSSVSSLSSATSATSASSSVTSVSTVSSSSTLSTQTSVSSATSQSSSSSTLSTQSASTSTSATSLTSGSSLLDVSTSSSLSSSSSLSTTSTSLAAENPHVITITATGEPSAIAFDTAELSSVSFGTHEPAFALVSS